MEDYAFRELLGFFNLSWKGYRRVRKGVKRRVFQHMQALECKTISDYLHAVRRDETLLRVAEGLLKVCISRFFRDKRLWEVLENGVLPDRLNGKKDAFHIWCAGCASGEEVYTIKILLERIRQNGKNEGSFAQPVILASDTGPVALQRAKAGRYPPSSLRDVPPEIRSEYFFRHPDGSYEIADGSARGIRWMRHDYVKEATPGFDFDLIFLRNGLLTYWDDPVKTRVLNQILDRLIPGGLFIIGGGEKVDPETARVSPTDLHPSIWVKHIED